MDQIELNCLVQSSFVQAHTSEYKLNTIISQLNDKYLNNKYLN